MKKTAMNILVQVLCKHKFVSSIFKIIYFNWRIITPVHCDGLWYTSTWVSHRHPRVPFLLNPPPTSLQAATEPWLWVPYVTHRTPTGYLFYTRQCICFSAVLSNHPALSFSHCVQKSVLYVCVSFAALHVGWSVLSFEIPYICINVWYVSFSVSQNVDK